MRKQMTRIQRKRTQGWKSPPSTRFCGRGTKYGNHFRVIKKGKNLFAVENTLNKKQGAITYKDKQAAVEVACQLHTYFLQRKYQTDEEMKKYLEPLKEFKNLSCWCKLEDQCHVDHLITFIKRYWPEDFKDENN